MNPLIFVGAALVVMYAASASSGIAAVEKDVEHLASDLVDLFVREPVARHDPALRRTHLLNFPAVSVTRPGYNHPQDGTQPDAPFYYLNAEAHVLPGGGIAFVHGPLPAHTVAEISQDYVAPSNRW